MSRLLARGRLCNDGVLVRSRADRRSIISRALRFTSVLTCAFTSVFDLRFLRFFPLPLLFLLPPRGNFFLSSPSLLLLTCANVSLPNTRPQACKQERQRPLDWSDSFSQPLHPFATSCFALPGILVEKTLRYLLRRRHLAGSSVAIVCSRCLILALTVQLSFTLRLSLLTFLLLRGSPPLIRGLSLAAFIHNAVPPASECTTVTKKACSDHPKAEADGEKC